LDYFSEFSVKAKPFKMIMENPIFKHERVHAQRQPMGKRATNRQSAPASKQASARLPTRYAK
jgi:hypothetical protein